MSKKTIPLSVAVTEAICPDIIGLSGGKKQFWLRVHRAEIEGYYFKYGPEATLKYYNLQEATLERFFERKNRDIKLNKLSGSDRWVLRVAMEGGLISGD